MIYYYDAFKENSIIQKSLRSWIHKCSDDLKGKKQMLWTQGEQR